MAMAAVMVMEVTCEYRPLAAQARAHLASQHGLLYLGGLGSGKTLFGVHDLAKAMVRNPKSDAIIGAPTYAMIRDVVMPTFKDWIPDCLYKWNKSGQYIDWLPTGRQIFFVTGERPNHARGKNVGYAWIDEPAQLPDRRLWDIVAGRVRCPRATYKRQVATTTPNGYNWLIDLFVNGGAEYCSVRSRTRDNFHLGPEYERRLRGLYGEEFAAQELDAKVVMASGFAWPIYKSVHSQFSPGEMLQRSRVFFGGADFGYTNPACLIIGGLDSDGRWYLVRIWYKTQQTALMIAKQAKIFQDEFNVQAWFVDPEDPAAAKEMRNQGCHTIPAINDIIPGVRYTRTLFQVRGDGLPRIQISRELEPWFEEQRGYKYPKREPGSVPNKKKDEKPIGQYGNHAMDATRYMTYTHQEMFGGQVYHGTYRPVERSQWRRN